MKSNYKLLGEFIQQVNSRNDDMLCTNLKGLSMNKTFRKTTSNIVGTDLSKYKIVKYNQFAVDFMSAIRVHRMPIAINKSKNDILVSPAYAVFEVIDEACLLPDYLMMWFSRPEFDRYADFRSDAAIRGGYGWNELCATNIDIPTYAEQLKIVRHNKIVADRIALKQKINDNLEVMAHTYFDKEVKIISESQKIKELGRVITGKTPSTDFPEYYGHDIPFIKTPDMHGTPFVTTSECWLSTIGADSQPQKYIPPFSLIVACIGANAGEVAITTYTAQTNQQINSVITKFPYSLYFSIKNMQDDFRALGDGSSTMLNINKSSFEEFRVIIPLAKNLSNIESKLKHIFHSIYSNQLEIDKLHSMQHWIISKLSC